MVVVVVAKVGRRMSRFAECAEKWQRLGRVVRVLADTATLVVCQDGGGGVSRK